MLKLQKETFAIATGTLPLPMAQSDATAKRLLKLGKFGADLIRFPSGGKVASHTHPGSHFLFVLSGTGFVNYDGFDHELHPGICYAIPGGVEHGIKAITELTLLAIADDHRDAASDDRLEIVKRGKSDAYSESPTFQEGFGVVG